MVRVGVGVTEGAQRGRAGRRKGRRSRESATAISTNVSRREITMNAPRYDLSFTLSHHVRLPSSLAVVDCTFMSTFSLRWCLCLRSPLPSFAIQTLRSFGGRLSYGMGRQHPEGVVPGARASSCIISVALGATSEQYEEN